MRIPFLFCFINLLGTALLLGQMESSVHRWETAEVLKTKSGTERKLFDGSGKILSKHQLKGLSLKSGKKLNYNTSISGDELFFMIKEGPIQVSLNGNQQELDTGSIVFVMPGDELTFLNNRKDDVFLYEMRMFSGTTPKLKDAKSGGPSFSIDWYDMIYKPHDKGGVRQLFDRKTAMLKRFDIHITSLDPNISSHPPHTHINEEIILMIDGEGEMQLDGEKQKITTGDAAWIASNIPHNFTNKANRPAVYFAIQWN